MIYFFWDTRSKGYENLKKLRPDNQALTTNFSLHS